MVHRKIIRLVDNRNRHDKKVIEDFNNVAKHFDESGLLLEILGNWADDGKISSITEHLKNRLIEYNIEI